MLLVILINLVNMKRRKVLQMCFITGGKFGSGKSTNGSNK